MAKQEFITAISAYTKTLSDIISSKQQVRGVDLPCTFERNTLERLENLICTAFEKCGELESALEKLPACGTRTEESFFVKDNILPLMQELRAAIDEAETLTAKEYWSVPTYAEILYSVR